MEKFKKMSIRFFFLVLILPSCIEAENEFEFESVKKIIDKHELELVGFDKDYNQGLKLDDLSEFEIIAKSITGKHHDSSRLLSIYSKNGININDRFFLEFLNNSLKNEDINELNFTKGTYKILCPHNPGAVYKRLNTSNPLVDVDVTFSYGNGLINNFDITLAGFPFGVSLGKKSFNQNTFPSNGGYYGGIITITLNYNIFIEDIGTFYVSEPTHWKVKIEACNGTAYWIQLVQ
jgi:hypothetical protein